MAETVKAKTGAEPPGDMAAAKRVGKPLKLMLVIGGACLLLGFGGAVGYFKLAGGAGGESARQAGPPPTNSSSVQTEAQAPGTIFDMDPFIVNLADAPEVRYLKLTIKLELERPDVSAEIAARLPQMRDAILILLSSKDAASLRTTQGKFQLRDEIVQRVNALLPRGGTRTVYFTEFVVQ